MNCTTFTQIFETMRHLQYIILSLVSIFLGCTVDTTDDLLPTRDSHAPNLFLITPSPSSNVGKSVNLLTEVEDDIQVALVSFYIDGVLIGELDEPPYVLPYEFPSTSLDGQESTFVVTATDNAGNQSEVKADVTYNKDFTDTEAPRIFIVTPVLNQEIKGTATIHTKVSDNVGIDKVQFFVDDILVSEIKEPPFRIGYDFSNFPSGEREVKVVAFDTSKLYAESSRIVIVDSDATPPGDPLKIKKEFSDCNTEVWAIVSNSNGSVISYTEITRNQTIELLKYVPDNKDLLLTIVSKTSSQGIKIASFSGITSGTYTIQNNCKFISSDRGSFAISVTNAPNNGLIKASGYSDWMGDRNYIEESSSTPSSAANNFTTQSTIKLYRSNNFNRNDLDKILLTPQINGVTDFADYRYKVLEAPVVNQAYSYHFKIDFVTTGVERGQVQVNFPIEEASLTMEGKEPIPQSLSSAKNIFEMSHDKIANNTTPLNYISIANLFEEQSYRLHATLPDYHFDVYSKIGDFTPPTEWNLPDWKLDVSYESAAEVLTSSMSGTNSTTGEVYLQNSTQDVTWTILFSEGEKNIKFPELPAEMSHLGLEQEIPNLQIIESNVFGFYLRGGTECMDYETFRKYLFDPLSKRTDFDYEFLRK